jgi:hypothetical protein
MLNLCEINRQKYCTLLILPVSSFILVPYTASVLIYPKLCSICPLEAPMNLTVKEFTDGKVLLSWNPVNQDPSMIRGRFMGYQLETWSEPNKIKKEVVRSSSVVRIYQKKRTYRCVPSTGCTVARLQILLHSFHMQQLNNWKNNCGNWNLDCTRDYLG